MIYRLTTTLCFLALLMGGTAAAQTETEYGLPTVALTDITEIVARKSGKTFLIDYRVHPQVVIGQVRPRDIDYPSLLTVLRNNDLAAVSDGDKVSIVPVQRVRQYALPLLYADNDSLPDDEWVTRVVILKNADARPIVPIVRPLLPQAGHLAAHPASRSILIADRYANTKRIADMILRIDAATPAQSLSSPSSSASPSQ